MTQQPVIDTDLREHVIQLAQDAAAAILGIYDSDFAVEHKWIGVVDVGRVINGGIRVQF